MREKMCHVQKCIDRHPNRLAEGSGDALQKCRYCTVYALEFLGLGGWNGGMLSSELAVYTIASIEGPYPRNEYRGFDVEGPRIRCQGRVMKQHVVGKELLSALGRNECLELPVKV